MGKSVVVDDPDVPGNVFFVVVDDPDVPGNVFRIWVEADPDILPIISGAGNSSVAGATSSGSGSVVSPGITGAGASTSDGATSSGAGTVATPAITGSGASTAGAAASAGAGTVSGGGGFDAETLFFDDTIAGNQLATTKRAGVDTLPVGASITGTTLNITGTVTLDRWDLRGYFISHNSGTATITNCELEELSGGNFQNLVYIAPGVTSTTIQNSTLYGQGINSTMSALLKQDVSGTGFSAVAPGNITFEYNRVARYLSDGLKLTGPGVIRRNFFDTAVALANTPTAWDSVTTFPLDYAVTDGGNTFISKLAGNTNHATTDTTWWRAAPAPHSDQVNPYAMIGAGQLSITENFFNRSDKDRKFSPFGQIGIGINNSYRGNLNTGTDLPHGLVVLSGNVMAGGETLNTYPVSMGTPQSSVNFVGDTFDGTNRVTANSGGAYIFPDGYAGNGHTVVVPSSSYTRPVKLVSGASDPAGKQLVGFKTLKFAGNAGTQNIQLEGFSGGIRSFLAAGDVILVMVSTSATTSRTLGIAAQGVQITTASLFANSSYDTNAIFAVRGIAADADAILTITGLSTSSDIAAVTIMALKGYDATTLIDTAAGTIKTAVSTLGLHNHQPDPPAADAAVVGTGDIFVMGTAASAGNTAGETDVTMLLSSAELVSGKFIANMNRNGTAGVSQLAGQLTGGVTDAAAFATGTLVTGGSTSGWAAATFRLK